MRLVLANGNVGEYVLRIYVEIPDLYVLLLYVVFDIALVIWCQRFVFSKFAVSLDFVTHKFILFSQSTID